MTCRTTLALTLAFLLPTQAAPDPDRIRTRIATFAPNTLIEVKTILGTKWKGNLGDVTADSFEIGHRIVRFDEVKSVRDASHLSAPKQAGLAAVFILAGLAVLYITLGLIATATGGD